MVAAGPVGQVATRRLGGPPLYFSPLPSYPASREVFRTAGFSRRGTLGPDLSTLFSRLGESGTAAVLTSLPFPTMQPLYHSRPLTAAEQRDLLALLRTAAGQPPPLVPFNLVLGATASLALVLVAVALGGRRRLRPVRLTLLAAGKGGRP